jgi:hypothetical protein
MPTPPLHIEASASGTQPHVTAAAWLDDTFDFWSFDRLVDDLAIRGEPLRVDDALVRAQVEIRVQRVRPLRTPASREPWFDALLDLHDRRHDVSKPLVRADLDHARDAWQWSIRLDADAPVVVQLAVLCHDIERLVSEAERRVEHLAADYQNFKDAHARTGARLAAELFAQAAVPSSVARDACALVADHERTGASAEIRAVNDADALSFFSLNSPGYLAYFGEDQTARKVDYTLARMSSVARAHLRGLRMPGFVRRCLAHHQLA